MFKTRPPRKKAKKKAVGAESAGIIRKAALDALCQGNPWVAPFFAQHTFEVDLVGAGNSDKVIGVLRKIYKDEATIAASKTELQSHDISVYGQRVLTMANRIGKGWFAILVGQLIDHHTTIPEYIVRAILFAHGPVSKEIVSNILNCRLARIKEDDQFFAMAIKEFECKLDAFQRNEIDFNGIRVATIETFWADKINNILACL
jgi:putative ATP-dependent endonuclease of OLD family